MRSIRTVLALGLTLASWMAVAAEPTQNKLVIHADKGKEKIDRNIYGHFAEHLGRCIYEGVWVGEDSAIPNTRGIRNDTVAALKKIKIPVLRWPGGCFADEYHWRDGIGPKEQRPSMINTHWGGVVENNHFGTHEFMDLCEQLECEPYICGNMGSGTVREMQEWVEYLTFDGESPMANLRRQNGREQPWKVKYWGVGNENWGCGGNMRPEYYADEYRRYATYLRNFSGNRLYKIACGPNGGDLRWTDVVMGGVGTRMQALALHYYCGSGKRSRSATQFDEADWAHLLSRALHIDELIRQHVEIMDRHDPQNKVALLVDEWGAWHAVEPGTTPGFLYQQNTMRDALVAGVTLNIFNQHCRRVKMSNIAQTINVLQAMILTDKEKLIVTPTYHVYEMYTVHHDATLLPSETQGAEYAVDNARMPAVHASASRDGNGKIHVTLCNLDPKQPATVDCELNGAKVAKISGRVLSADAMQAHNTFDKPEVVKPAAFDDARPTEQGFSATLPPMSVVVLSIE
jgi:alpha-N-arabinofuranosidase